MKSMDFTVEAIIAEMAARLGKFLADRDRRDPLILGIQTGGVWVAERLRTQLGIDHPLGRLNIAFYRDDFSRIGMHPHVTPSLLPFSVEDRHVILVDDVLHTGRTVRAAMNEIFDYGRPASIALAVLIDRGAHELPVQADITGKAIELGVGEHVKLLGPEPLQLEFRRSC
ncbi:MAG: bifunctional pyr operon transcriptional regulator/uracil phosphoribosyltransferase PyrR [Gammaproteobacteria bacterium]|jgi:pyrimidine operon attenuation protein/uracil phosphoribosyltransferase|nr:MAG: bifunctional pyr operon transcriptional regulator/uracil phosphoribosyltransferase PyrR [Gammaproteobacteria bacterium]